MKRTCLHIPRIMIPHGEFKQWAAAAETYEPQPFYGTLDAPSAVRLTLAPDVGPEKEQARIEEIRDEMYDDLEDVLEKLNRGLLFIEHTKGELRYYGIVACLDLEAYTMSEGEVSMARPSQHFDMGRAEQLARLRERSAVEFPAVSMFYRDKKCTISRILAEADLEEVYSFDVGGEHIRGMFIPADAASEIAADMHPRSGIAFAVAAGEEEVAAAKLMWERVRAPLSAEERELHPARFLLAEFVNVYGDGPVLTPIHRLIAGADPAALMKALEKKVKCTREGEHIRILARDPAEAIRRTDAQIAEFLKSNGGTVRYGEKPAEGETAVFMPAIGREDVFGEIKDGKLLPAHSFRAEGCYRYEGREISYD